MHPTDESCALGVWRRRKPARAIAMTRHRRGLHAALLIVAALASAACQHGEQRPVATTTAAVPASTGQASPTPGEPARRPVTLAFAGDVHFMKVPGARLAHDPDTALGPVAAVLRRADVAMVNLETTVTTRGTPQQKHYVFRAPASAFRALRAAGVDVVTMANNHGMDYGLAGLRDSLAAAAAARFPLVGIGRNAAQAYAPWVLTVGGQRIAILGATQVLEPGLQAAWTAGRDKPGLAATHDERRLLAAVRQARALADTVVVYLHWGEEGNPCPTGSQRKTAHLLARAGADIVVGSHAHTLQGSGWLGRTYVAYGLGNFYWWNWFSASNRTTGVLTLTVAAGRVTRTAWTPAVIRQGAPIPLTGAIATRARSRLAALRSCTDLSTRPS
jgi:poly-gamma-glutamate capsule biosynthesis protein CapA/YwtB (metallophosphatase superfamily)